MSELKLKVKNMSQNTSSKSVLINPLIARDVSEPHRAATPLELFYDLIYVLAIASLAAELHHAISAAHHVIHAIGMYFFILFLVWWPWNSYTWFASGFDTDDAQFRLASFAQMIGVVFIAVGIKAAFLENDFLVMMIGYVIMRVPYILMWLKVAHDDENYRSVAFRYAIGVAGVQIIWTISILYFSSWAIFIGLIVLEMLVPYLAESTKDKGKNTHYHFAHIEERMGLLTIIVLGESILAVVYTFEKAVSNLTADIMSLAVGAVLILFSMWWLYFDDFVEEHLGNQKKAFIWAYGHYFVFAFATAVGVLISVNADVMTGSARVSEFHAVLALSVAIVGYLISVWLCHDFLMEKKGPARYELIVLAVVVLAIAYFTQSILLIGVAFTFLNILRLRSRHKQFSLLKEK